MEIVLVIKHFRTYLLRKPFIVQIDHSALQLLKQFRKKITSLTRWSLQLQPNTLQCNTKKDKTLLTQVPFLGSAVLSDRKGWSKFKRLPQLIPLLRRSRSYELNIVCLFSIGQHVCPTTMVVFVRISKLKDFCVQEKK